MKIIMKILGGIFVFLFFIYLALPNPDFPKPLDDVLTSNEPADIETNLRRGYYTDYLRNQVISHYLEVFKNVNIFKIQFPSIRLNYPPEEAQFLIRDQTRSTYLEEIVHPFRESIFINGFEPKLDKDRIVIGSKVYQSKVIVRYIPSNVAYRLFLGFCLLFLLLIMGNLWSNAYKDFAKNLKKLR